ncbi:hypothetical protein, partial [Mesorhizobium sp. M2A.F.Ca.ET.042.01.1.1]|uniref:hypothetical protein n=1 Tax=Mesorhizobium sp. M2A.F.Ca.ET.042.01.1.1 TaxID=2496745 RepID=UPI001AECCEB1
LMPIEELLKNGFDLDRTAVVPATARNNSYKISRQTRFAKFDRLQTDESDLCPPLGQGRIPMLNSRQTCQLGRLQPMACYHGRVAQPFGFRPHRSGRTDFPHQMFEHI